MITEQRIAAALKMADDTKDLRLGKHAIVESGDVFRHCFGEVAAQVVADTNTFNAAGWQTVDTLRRAGIEVIEPLILEKPRAYIEDVNRVQEHLAGQKAIAVAVGSGTINDLVKLASHRCDRPYMVVATAASMDGYTAYGASITADGAKQTFFCPAPRAVVADMNVISEAPSELNAAGYADLAAKIPAGADWILADAWGIEPIAPDAWFLVQDNLRNWLSNPAGVRRGESRAIADLTEGLLMTGFGMQQCKSSRPASGAEHQFSHLWDMQHHEYHGAAPLHGCKVAIGSLASTRLYEQLFEQSLEHMNVGEVIQAWPTVEQIDENIKKTHSLPELQTTAMQECRAKYLDMQAATRLFWQLKCTWPALRVRLQRQLIPSDELQEMLAAAGAPEKPEQIGISAARLRQSYYEAQQIRRRFTVLDLAHWTGRMPLCLDRIFPAKTRRGGKLKAG